MAEMRQTMQTREEVEEEEEEPDTKKSKQQQQRQITIQFHNENGEAEFFPLSVPFASSPAQLLSLVRQLIKERKAAKEEEEEDDDEDDAERPILFYVSDKEVTETLEATVSKLLVNLERAVPVVYKPQAIFRVRPVTRCCSSMPGHTQPVVSALFSTDGSRLATAAGDCTVRLWDLSTETPLHEMKAHSKYVLALSWAPDASGRLASGDKAGQIALWDGESGKNLGKLLRGHKDFITALSWQPLHLAEDGFPWKLASSSKDGDVRVWDVRRFQCLFSLTSHTQSVTCLRWSGQDLLISGSEDKTIKVWRASDGVLCRTLQGHGHWVNVLALNTDYAMRTGAFDPAKFTGDTERRNSAGASGAEKRARAKRRYESVVQSAQTELMVSGSDDHTLFLWRHTQEKKPIARMTGHQQLVIDVRFSPDARLLASASFDKSVRLWDGRTGRFVAVLRGHVQKVYQLAWSADSRLLVSGSSDSTLKLWSTHKKCLSVDLPGHGDEIYAVDWSPDGQRVVSAGKDALVRLWRR